MQLKRWLILVPLILSIFLLQSYFWVPTYENQAVGNPNRLTTFIEGSIGDARILNPILSADSASSQIANKVFEGLLELDENLNLRGRLATDWSITETAYLVVNPFNRFPDGTPVNGKRVIEKIQKGLTDGTLSELTRVVEEMDLIEPSRHSPTVSMPGRDKDGKPIFIPIQVTVQYPERVRIRLGEVDQDLFERLTPILGERFFLNFPYERFIEIEPELDPKAQQYVRSQFSTILPIAEHNPEILFHLRKGVTFHDGHEFDAHDVKFTYEAIMNSKNLSPRTSDFEPIKRVEVVDPATVKVTYKRLFSPAINAWTMGILPEHLLNDKALQQEMDQREISGSARKGFGVRASQFNRKPVGTGRFQFSEWLSDEYIHLTRFNDYWDGPPEYHEYYMRIIPDLLTQEVEFHAGAVDYYAAQPHQVARYKKDTAYQAFSSLGFGYSYIGYNNRRPLFADPRVRNALTMAINTEEFIQYLLYGEGEQVTGPYPKNTEWYDQSIAPLPYDPNGALEILESLGWEENEDGWLEKDGQIFEFNLITNQGNPIRKNILTIAQNAWKNIGIKCNTQIFEWAVFLKDFVNTGAFDAVVLGWSMGIDPDLYQLWHSSQAGPQQLNFVGYKNPKADKLIIRIRQEYNRDRQREMTHQLHRIIYEDQPYTFLYAPLSTSVLDKKIVIVDRQPDSTESYRKIFPIKSGDHTFYFHKWRKLEITPDF